MDIKYIIVLISLVYFLLSFFISLRSKRNLANISFVVLTWIISFWAMGLFLYEHPLILSSLFWIKIVYFFVLFLIGSLFFVSFVFPYRQRSLFLPMVFYFLSIAPFIWVLFFSKLWVQDVVYHSWGVETVLGPAYIYFGIWCLIFLGWTILNLVQKYRTARDVSRLQLRYLFLGIGLSALFAIILDVVFPIVMGTSRYFWLSPVSTLFMVGFMMLAIIKYRLFEIKVVLTEVLVAVMGSILLVLPFLMKNLLLIIIFLLFCPIAYLLLVSVYREIRAKGLLEQKVKERTKEIEERKEELEKFYKLTVGRELRMVELKKKIKEMEGESSNTFPVGQN